MELTLRDWSSVAQLSISKRPAHSDIHSATPSFAPNPSRTAFALDVRHWTHRMMGDTGKLAPPMGASGAAPSPKTPPPSMRTLLELEGSGITEVEARTPSPPRAERPGNTAERNRAHSSTHTEMEEHGCGSCDQMPACGSEGWTCATM